MSAVDVSGGIWVISGVTQAVMFWCESLNANVRRNVTRITASSFLSLDDDGLSLERCHAPGDGVGARACGLLGQPTKAVSTATHSICAGTRSIVLTQYDSL